MRVPAASADALFLGQCLDGSSGQKHGTFFGAAPRLGVAPAVRLPGVARDINVNFYTDYVARRALRFQAPPRYGDAARHVASSGFSLLSVFRL